MSRQKSKTATRAATRTTPVKPVRPGPSLIPRARTPDEVLAERQAKAETKRQMEERKALEARVEELQHRLGVVEEIRSASAVEAPKPRPGRVLSGDKREACAVAMLSDCHLEERVDPAKVNGLNEFNPTIAERRMARFFAAIEWLVREQQSMFAIRSLLLTLLGDVISGYIHEELLESNYMSPTHAVVFAKRLIVNGLRFLLAQTQLSIHIVCKCGNHGRTTPKLRIATAVDNSYEWLLYQMLASEFANEPRITWQIDAGHHSLTPVYGMRIHTHHGDSVRSNGGIGGIEVPLNRARVQWHAKYDADISLIGHFHQYISGEKLVVNGSLVGYGAYSDWLPSAAPEPARQAFFLIDSKRGKCQATPIWVAE